jgi:hypothetical protein
MKSKFKIFVASQLKEIWIITILYDEGLRTDPVLWQSKFPWEMILCGDDGSLWL